MILTVILTIFATQAFGKIWALRSDYLFLEILGVITLMLSETWELNLPLSCWNLTAQFALSTLLAQFFFWTLASLLSAWGLTFPTSGYTFLLQRVLTFGGGLLLLPGPFSSTLPLLELQSYTLYLILGHTNRALYGSHGVLTYFLIGSFGTFFTALGWAFSTFDGTNEGNFQEATMPSLLVWTGISLKLGLAPLHVWLPSTYDGINLRYLAWASTVTVLPLLVFLIKHSVASVSLIWGFALLSIGTGGVGILTSSKIKGFLALSGISNLGFILSAQQAGLFTFWVYLLVYTLALLGIIFILTDSIFTSECEVFTQARGFSEIWLLGASGLAFLTFTLTGIPPFAVFFMKANLVLAGIAQGFEQPVLMLLIISIISIAGYTRLSLAILAQGGSAEELGYSRTSSVINSGIHALILGLVLDLVGLNSQLWTLLTRTMFLIPALPLLLVALNYGVSTKLTSATKSSSYECGFVPTENQILKPFSVSFFVVGLLFLLFDLELLWLFPTVFICSLEHKLTSIVLPLFFLLVILSLVYEVLSKITLKLS